MSDRRDPAGSKEDLDEAEAGVLDPDDLDIRERDGVREHGEGRYVISAEGGASVDDRSAAGESAPRSAEATCHAREECESGDEDGGSDADEDRPHLDALAAELAGLSAPYGLALAGKADDETASVQVAAGDPVAVLGAAVRWYAQRVDPDGDADETAVALLEAAGLGIGGE